MLKHIFLIDHIDLYQRKIRMLISKKSFHTSIRIIFAKEYIQFKNRINKKNEQLSNCIFRTLFWIKIKIKWIFLWIIKTLTDISILVWFFDHILKTIKYKTEPLLNKQTNFAVKNSFNTCSTDLFPNAIRVDRALARI